MNQKVKYKRILLKFSGEFLGDNSGRGISIDSISQIVKVIQSLSTHNIQIGIVLGAGNIFRGGLSRQKEKSVKTFNQVQADKAGMMGTVINSLLLADLLSQNKIKNTLYTAIPIDTILSFNPVQADESLKQGHVNIYAGGTSNPFVTTDTAAVLKAIETNSDVLIKATKVDGVYDKDPVKNKDAKMFKNITYMEVLEKKLKAMDLTAMSLAMENNMPIAVLNFFKKSAITSFIQGRPTGTLIRGK